MGSDWPFAVFLIVLTMCITTCTINRDLAVTRSEIAKAQAAKP